MPLDKHIDEFGDVSKWSACSITGNTIGIYSFGNTLWIYEYAQDLRQAVLLQDPLSAEADPQEPVLGETYPEEPALPA